VPAAPAGLLRGISWPQAIWDPRLVDELLAVRARRDPDVLMPYQKLPRLRPQGLLVCVHLTLEISLANPAVEATPLFQYQ
jgi:hypothetical protein